MVNEFVYCPRLFYYETVESVFVHNPDTLEGAQAHRRVDTANPGSLETLAAGTKKKKSKAPAAAMPPPDLNQHPGAAAASEPESASAQDSPAEPPPPDTIHARSISLYSQRLHLTAKLDLVEGEAAVPGGPLLYTPVEYKKGRPRESDEGRDLWDADRVQLMLQILLLRENGFPCEEGIVYYRETRQRVRFTPTAEDENWAQLQVAEARQAQRQPMPPPLEHSPKCPRCSLVSICLPDETRLLAAPEPSPASSHSTVQPDLFPLPAPPTAPPQPERTALLEYILRMPAPGIRRVKADPDMRRLVAPNPDTRTLYLNTPGAWVGKRGETVTVKDRDQSVGEFLLKDIHHVALFGPVQISTQTIQAFCEADIPLSYFSTGGWFYGLTRGHTLKNVLTRIQQFRTAADDLASLTLARQMVYGKIINQRTLLMRNHIEPPRDVLHGMKYFAHAALIAPGLPQLLGVEGNAAGLYFGAFGGMLKPRRPQAKPTAFSPDDSAPTASAAHAATTAPPPPDQETDFHRQPLTFPFFPDSRNRRPPRDPVNALLSLTYSLLAKECTIACHAVGLDPYVGFLHQPRHGRPALALDLMEEFRPLLADSTVLTLINNGMVSESDFILASHAAALTAAGRKTVFTAWEQRLADPVTHPLFGYRVSYRRALELQVRILAKHLTGEIPDYVPFMTR